MQDGRRSERSGLPVAWLSSFGLAGLLLFSGCQPARVESPQPPPGPAWLVPAPARIGLDFEHDPGLLDGSHFLPQIIGSGAALLDSDNRGRLDIYLINNGGPRGTPNRYFRQREDGTFADASAGSGLAVAGYGMGAAVGDVNNDGLPDLYLTRFGGDLLFLNEGSGRFRDITREAGTDNPVWGTSASFVDFDRDGWLDLVVVNYLTMDPQQPCHDAVGKRAYCHPNTFPGSITRLFRNRGKDSAGKWLGFEDRTVRSGLATLPGPGLGVLCADFNGDGWPDLFIANDAKPNHLWINQKNGTFKEEAVARGLALNSQGQMQGNMGVAYGDVDGDGLPDLFVTHLSSEYHALWKQGPRGLFQDRVTEVGLTRARWRGTGFGTVLADFNHDGALDLAIVNGAVARSAPSSGSDLTPYAERNQLFASDGKGKFLDLSNDNPDFCDTPGVSRGLAVGDLDGDGGLDLLVTRIGAPARLFFNRVPDRGHWLMVRAVERVAPRDALGAEVRVRAGDQTWWRLIQSGSSYLCSNDPRAHFGLGSADRVDEIVITWPDGSEETFPGGAGDRLLVLRKGSGQPRVPRGRP